MPFTPNKKHYLSFSNLARASCLVSICVSLATKFLLLRSPVYTIEKHQQNPNTFTQRVNGNEPIENMQLYMGYSLEKLEHRLGLN